MEFLEKAQMLLQDLKKEKRSLEKVRDSLKNKTTADKDFEQLYAKEFDLTMRISSAFNKFKEAINQLEKNEDTEFIARRLRIQGDAIIGETHEFDFE